MVPCLFLARREVRPKPRYFGAEVRCRDRRPKNAGRSERPITCWGEYTMVGPSIAVPRRTALKQLAAGVAAGAIARPAFAVPQTVKIGLIAPQTGPLALFNEEMAWALGHARKTLNDSIKINGTVHPLEFVVKDSQSNPNRAAEVTQDLILKEKVGPGYRVRHA